jgi:hypothetical protein
MPDASTASMATQPNLARSNGARPMVEKPVHENAAILERE